MQKYDPNEKFTITQQEITEILEITHDMRNPIVEYNENQLHMAHDAIAVLHSKTSKIACIILKIANQKNNKKCIKLTTK